MMAHAQTIGMQPDAGEVTPRRLESTVAESLGGVLLTLIS